MKAAFIGVGKMGYPVSLAHCLEGKHEIFAFDVNPNLRDAIRNNTVDFYEPKLHEQTETALKSKRYHVCDSVAEAVNDAQIVFVAVPTPSLPDNSFDNSYVEEAVAQIGTALRSVDRFVPVVIISTVLPGTTRAVLQPALERASKKKVGGKIGLDYSASFIAMGTTYEDAITPEFVLIGASDDKTASIVEQYYTSVVQSPLRKTIYGKDYKTQMLRMTFEEAELTKNVYNVHIGFKIIVANAVMELAHKLGHTNSDVVTNALGKAVVRIVGPKYLKGGMGDGGVCHGRDALALSWVAQKFNLSADPFDYIMQARAQQADWMAKFLMAYHKPIVIMGERYKSNTNITEFSAGKLVAGFLEYYGVSYVFYDPTIGKTSIADPKGGSLSPRVFLITLDEPFAKEFDYLMGDIVVDVWRCFSKEQIQTLKDKHVFYVPLGDSTDAKRLNR